jgi:hypothetical protein
LNYTIKSRHTLSLLYAPLETTSEGSVTNDIFFEGEVFPANTELVGTYKFNSYRFTYRYDIVQKPMFEFGLGFTAKIRDAEIALSSPGLQSEKTNVGFVPIINFRLLWKVNDKFGLLLDGDALAAPQGRAEDVLIAATYKFSDNFGFVQGTAFSKAVLIMMKYIILRYSIMHLLVFPILLKQQQQRNF